MPVFRRAGAALVAALALTLSLPLSAQSAPSTAPGAAADAYGLDVDAVLTPLGVEVDEGPFARASQEYPPQAAAVSEDEVLGAGPLPAGGELVKDIGILSAMAGANGQPLAAASAQAVDVELLSQGGTALITADLIRAMSTTDCVNAPSAAGTDFVNLRLAGQEDPIPTPAPNTVLAPELFTPLGLRVVLNEQHPTADGRGLVVNAIHIYNVAEPLVPGLFTGDIIVAHAMSTVNCPNGAPSTGGNNPIFITKNADKATAKRGDTVTYTATVQNKATEPCIVNQLIDHLPQAFEFVSTAGGAGTTAATDARPGGGTDVIIKPEGVTIAAGGSLTQTYVVKVKDDAAPGTYFNNVELLCSNLGNWVKGLDAPVQVVTDTPPPPRLPQCSDKKDNDGDGKIDFPNDPGCASPQDDDERDTMPRTGLPSVLAIAAVALAGGGLVLRRVLNARP
jgi:uncharacterized repeat protein (TIGR01451 family)